MNTPNPNYQRQMMSTPSTHSSRFNVTTNEGSFSNKFSHVDPQMNQSQLLN